MICWVVRLKRRVQSSEENGKKVVLATQRTLMVSVLCGRIFFTSMDKSKLIPPSLDVLFGGRVSRKLLMMNHVVGGGVRRMGLFLVVVVMLRGTVEANNSLDLCSEARLN